MEWIILAIMVGGALALLWLVVGGAARGDASLVDGRRVDVAHRVRVAVPMTCDPRSLDALAEQLADVELADRLRLTAPHPDLAVAWMTVLAPDPRVAEHRARRALERCGLVDDGVSAVRERPAPES